MISLLGVASSSISAGAGYLRGTFMGMKLFKFHLPRGLEGSSASAAMMREISMKIATPLSEKFHLLMAIFFVHDNFDFYLLIHCEIAKKEVIYFCST